MGPGNIFNQRPLPRRPISKKGLFSALARLLGGGRNTPDLHEELSQAILAFREDEPDQARIRLKRTMENLAEIERNGSQFVLNRADWRAINEIGIRALQTARQTNASPDVIEMLWTVGDKLRSFSVGKLDQR